MKKTLETLLPRNNETKKRPLKPLRLGGLLINH